MKWIAATTAFLLSTMVVTQHATASGLRQRFAQHGLAMATAQSTQAKAAAPASHQQVQVAVYNLQLENIPTVFGTIVTDSLLEEVRKLQGINAIGLSEIQEMISLEVTKQMTGCDESESCLAEISGALGVDELITGRLSESPSGRVIVLRRISQRHSQVISTFTQRLLIGNGDEFLAVLGEAVASLYHERSIRSGTTRGVAPEVARRLNPPPIPTWATYSAGTLAVLAGATGGVFGYHAHRTGEAFTQPSSQQNDATYWMTLQNQGQQYQQSANISFMLAGSFALTAVVMSLFTDWGGHSGGE